MSWLSDFLRDIFTGSARQEDKEKTLDPAHIQLTRHMLKPVAEGPTGDDEKFIAGEHFLNALEYAAEESAFGHLLGTSPQGVKIAARMELMRAVTAGQCSFFYEPREKQPIYAEDMFVPAKLFAGHALALLDQQKSVALAGVYAVALRALENQNRTVTYKQLSHGVMTYVDKKDITGNFEAGAAESRKPDLRGYLALQMVLRQRKIEGIQLS